MLPKHSVNGGKKMDREKSEEKVWVFPDHRGNQNRGGGV